MVAVPAFTSTSEDWLFLRILRRWIYNTGFVCYIFSLFALLPFLSSFLWRFNSCKNLEIKVLLENNLIFLLLVGFFITLWLDGFFWCIFSSKFLLVSLFLSWRLSSLLFPSLGFIMLSLSRPLFLGYLPPSCERFLNYF